MRLRAPPRVVTKGEGREMIIWAAMRRAFLLLPLALAFAACRGDKDRVLARVGKLKITQSEFQRKLAEVSSG